MPTVAYRVIRTRKRFTAYKEVKRELERTLDDVVKPHLIQRFNIVVMNWRHKPTFKGRKFITTDKIWVNVYPAGDRESVQIYNWVTKGTKRHPIRARRASRLAFMWGGKGSYKPKTKPRGKIGGPGVVVGGRMHYPQAVMHPGTEARDFENVIRADEKRWFSRTMENAWRRAIRQL